MSKKHVGARKKRLTTPAEERKRAVRFRHNPYKKIKEIITNKPFSFIDLEDYEDKIEDYVDQTILVDGAYRIKKKKRLKILKFFQKEKPIKSNIDINFDQEEEYVHIPEVDRLLAEAKEIERIEENHFSELESEHEVVGQMDKDIEQVSNENIEEEVDTSIEEHPKKQKPELRLGLIDIEDTTTLMANEENIEQTISEEKDDTIVVDNPEQDNSLKLEDTVKSVKLNDKENIQDSEQKQPDIKNENNQTIQKDAKQKTYKQLKREARNAYLDSVIDEPKANILKMIFLPVDSVKSVASVKGVTLNALAVLFLNILHWLAFGSIFASLVYHMINQAPYSVARMSFSSASLIAFFIAGFALISEYAIYYILSIFCGLLGDKITMRKLADISARGSMTSTILYIIAVFLVHINPIFTFILAILGIFIGLYTRAIGFDKYIELPKGRVLLLLAICLAIIIYIFFKLLPLFSHDIQAVMDLLYQK
ncbi:MAG: hypothetical protein IJ875_03565 [Solobacterium sp.]|nr:hypothetical protein [Solobacterium sp.]